MRSAAARSSVAELGKVSSKRPIAGAQDVVPTVKAELSTALAPEPEQFAQVMDSWPEALTAAELPPWLIGVSHGVVLAALPGCTVQIPDCAACTAKVPAFETGCVACQNVPVTATGFVMVVMVPPSIVPTWV